MEIDLPKKGKRPRSNDADGAWRRILSKVLFLVRNVALMTLNLSRPLIHEQPESDPGPDDGSDSGGPPCSDDGSDADPPPNHSAECVDGVEDSDSDGSSDDSDDSDNVPPGAYCQHRITSRSGTNQFVNIVRCVHCQATISCVRKVRNSLQYIEVSNVSMTKSAKASQKGLLCTASPSSCSSIRTVFALQTDFKFLIICTYISIDIFGYM